jgi:hypothetical protein
LVSLTANQKELMKIIVKFYAKIRQKLLAQRIHREIYNRLFPHLNQEKDYGYPFATDAQMAGRTEDLNPKEYLELIETHVNKMPAAHGRAFRYIMHRNIRLHMEMYEQLASHQVKLNNCSSHLVATRA